MPIASAINGGVNDFECLASTGVNVPETMFPKSAAIVHQSASGVFSTTKAGFLPIVIQGALSQRVAQCISVTICRRAVLC